MTKKCKYRIGLIYDEFGCRTNCQFQFGFKFGKNAVFLLPLIYVCYYSIEISEKNYVMPLKSVHFFLSLIY
jgi:hypothetical protein